MKYNQRPFAMVSLSAVGFLFLFGFVIGVGGANVEKLEALTEVLDGETTWLVAIIQPEKEGNKRFASELASANNVLKGMVRVAEVSAEAEGVKPITSALKITEFPAVFMFPCSATWLSERDRLPTPYKGNLTANEMSKWVQRTLPARFVQRLRTSNELDNLRLSPPDKMSLAVLFHNDTIAMPAFRALSLNFNDRILFYDVRVNNEKAKKFADRYRVTNIPGFAIVEPSGIMTGSETVEDSNVYEGELNYSQMADFVESKAKTVEERDALRDKREQQHEEETRRRNEEAERKRKRAAEKVRREKEEKQRKRQEWEKPFHDEAEEYKGVDGEFVVVRDEYPSHLTPAADEL